MNLKNPQEHSQLVAELKNGTVEFPPPKRSYVCGPCWIPKENILEDGDILNDYAFIVINGMRLPGHVVAAASMDRRFPEPGEEALHGCDRKSCRNPNHVCIGNNARNSYEAVIRDRLVHWHRDARAMPKGEANRMSKMSNREAAEMKWLIEHKTRWYSPEIARNHPLNRAVAINYSQSEATVKQLRKRESWRHLKPIRPKRLPKSADIPAGAVPPPPVKTGPLGPDAVKEILVQYWASNDRRHFVRDQANHRGVSNKAIYDALKGKTWPDEWPEIRRVSFAQHGMQMLSASVIQAIRASWDFYSPEFTTAGLLSALARWAKTSRSYIKKVTMGLARPEVQPDPSKVIPFDELKFKELVRRGTKHPRAKLTEGQVWSILRRLENGERVSSLALEFSVSEQVIYGIRNGHRYAAVFARFQRRRSSDSSATLPGRAH